MTATAKVVRKGSACGGSAPVLIVGSCEGEAVGGEVGPKLGCEDVGIRVADDVGVGVKVGVSVCVGV